MKNTNALPVPRAAELSFPTGDNFSIAVHAWLNGSSGSYRMLLPSAMRLIEADHDIDAIETWLDVKNQKSRHTVRSYRRESYRLLAWSVWFKEKPISGLTLSDVADYHKWLLAPEVHPDWKRRGWDLIRGPLKKSSLRQATAILNTLFRWLVEAGYVAGNPFRIFNDCLPEQELQESNRNPTETLFDKELWDWMLSRIDIYGSATQKWSDKRRLKRTHFLLTFMYWTGVYSFELVNAKMSQIANEGGVWVLKLGSGRRNTNDRVILLPPALDALRRYRMSRGLSELPVPGERDAPLISAYRENKHITPHYVNKLLKELFARLADDAKPLNKRWVEKLEAASARWIRYTLTIHNAQAGVPINDTIDQLRYKTTNTARRIYNDAAVSLDNRTKGLAKLLDYKPNH